MWMSELFIRKISFLSLGRICCLLALSDLIEAPWSLPLFTYSEVRAKPLGESPQDVLDLTSALPTQITAVSATYNIHFFHFSSVTLELCLGTIYPQGENKPITGHTSSRGSQSCTAGLSLPENRCFVYFVQLHSFAMAGKSNTHHSFMVGSINLGRFACKSCLRC